MALWPGKGPLEGGTQLSGREEPWATLEPFRIHIPLPSSLGLTSFVAAAQEPSGSDELLV